MRRRSPAGINGLEKRMSAFMAAARPLRLAVRAFGCAAFVLILSLLSTPRGYAGGGTLTVGMTAGDIPVTTGNPDQGFEGYRFVGYNLYDTLVLWDLSKAEKASEIRPGLATSWEIDPNNHKRWIVHLRDASHGTTAARSPLTMWCGIFNTAPNKTAPFFLAQQFAYSRSFWRM